MFKSNRLGHMYNLLDCWRKVKKILPDHGRMAGQSRWDYACWPGPTMSAKDANRCSLYTAKTKRCRRL